MQYCHCPYKLYFLNFGLDITPLFKRLSLHLHCIFNKSKTNAIYELVDLFVISYETDSLIGDPKWYSFCLLLHLFLMELRLTNNIILIKRNTETVMGIIIYSLLKSEFLNVETVVPTDKNEEICVTKLSTVSLLPVVSCGVL